MTMYIRPRALVALLFSAVAPFGCGGDAVSEKGASADDPVPVVVETAAMKDVDERLKIIGDVMPWQVQPLSFKVAGKIARLFVEEGTIVEKNQLVAVLDTVDYRLVRDLADVQVEGLRPNLERASALKAKEAVTAAQLDELESRMRAASIQRAQAAAQLSYAWLRAPAAGVVVKRMMSEGDLTDPAHPVAAIAELKRAKVILPVTQRDLPLFRQKQEVSLVEPETRRRYTGTVFSVGYAADEKTRAFPVTIEVANEDLTLRAGMVVEASVRIATHRGIFLPLDAVHRDALGGAAVFVVLGEPPRAAQRPVELGPLVGESVRIDTGLAPGDRVIVRGMVQDDEPVTAVALPDESAPDAGALR